MVPRILREDGEQSLRFVRNDNFIGLTIGARPIASTNPSDSAYLVKLFARIDVEERLGAKVAHLGGGMAWLPKMLTGYGYTQDIYELDPDVASFIQEGILADKYNVIVGDWHDTLTGQYDIIIYDIDSFLTIEEETFIRSHLLEGGLLLRLTD